jgi:LTXXQ motif family protein
MRRGVVCCACVCASLAIAPLSAQAGPLAGVVRGVTAAPRAVMGGLFGGHHGRHYRHAARRDSPSVRRAAHVARRESPPSPSANRDAPQLNSWWGAVYWPTAYQDTFGYIISGANEAGAFWAHSSNDIYDGVFVPAMASTLHADKPLGAGIACDGERNQAISLEPIQQELHPTPAQRALLDALRDALVQANSRARVSCTTPPLTPTARLETMWDRLRALRQAVGLIRTPLKTLYESLSDEQKARINSLAEAAAGRRDKVLEPQVCTESASRSREWPAKPIEEAVRPTEQQRATLGALAGTTSRLSALLLPSCPPAMLVTPTGRLEAVVNRLDSMIYAVTLERAALNNFYAALDEDQKARFDAEIRRPSPEHDRRAPP